MSSSSASIAGGTFDLGTLDRTSLYGLLEKAYPEAAQVDDMLNKITGLERHMDYLQGKINSSSAWFWVGIALAVILAFSLSREVLISLFYILPGAILAITQALRLSHFKRRMKGSQAEWGLLLKTVEELARGSTAFLRIPIEYRMPLTIRTMLKYLRNGQADSWKECSLLCDEQIHRWVLEQNSAEALELQKYTALATDRAARNAGLAAAASFLSWF
ncbi:MAG: hypothetical protein FWE69_06100 [Clostridiales bacterium]|nr:hypothetical protein [Clostridiales bacterium]